MCPPTFLLMVKEGDKIEELLFCDQLLYALTLISTSHELCNLILTPHAKSLLYRSGRLDYHSQFFTASFCHVTFQHLPQEEAEYISSSYRCLDWSCNFDQGYVDKSDGNQGLNMLVSTGFLCFCCSL